MSDFKTNTKEMDEFIKRLKLMEESDFNKQFLLEEAIKCVDDTKRNTPVITGALKAMWGIGSQNIVIASSLKTGKVVTIDKSLASVDDVSGGYEVEIWNGMIYASQVEDGRFDENGNQVSEGRKMATKALDTANRLMNRRYKAAIKKQFKSLDLGE